MRKRQWWALGAAASFGLALGLGAFTFGYAKGASYLTNDPAACANCHVMGEHFAAWERGSHRNAATCNDCHTPHDFAGKYATKALNGFWHSFYFTTGRYPDPLRITERNRRVTEDACRYCHAQIVDAIDPQVATRPAGADDTRDAARDGRLAPAGSRPRSASEGARQASVVPAPLSSAALAAIAALQGGAGDGRPVGQGTDAHTDPELSCIRCHTYVGHWVR